MAVSHIDANQRVYGPQKTEIPGSPVQYFINPVGIQSIILSAVELGSLAVLATDSLQAFSANASLLLRAGSSSRITFPLVQGMGFVTAIYRDLMPVIQSAVFFRSMVRAAQPRAGVFKYRITLGDNKSWLLYVVPSNGQDPRLQLVSNTQIQGVRGWNGFIQVSKNPAGANGEAIYDTSAGVYSTSGAVSASVTGNAGTYQLKWTRGGLANGPSLLMYALPHHLQSFSASTAGRKTLLQLQTTTKGVATAVLADSWTIVEPSLPTAMNFAPWTPSLGSKVSLSSYASELIRQVAESEILQDMDAQTNLDSMYFSGKALSKFAVIIYVVRDLLHLPDLATQGLGQLKAAFTKFAMNQQIFPLVYDSRWGGIVSSATYRTGNVNQDFGNTYYNDHHFHYGGSSPTAPTCLFGLTGDQVISSMRQQ